MCLNVLCQTEVSLDLMAVRPIESAGNGGGSALRSGHQEGVRKLFTSTEHLRHLPPTPEEVSYQLLKFSIYFRGGAHAPGRRKSQLSGADNTEGTRKHLGN